MLKTVLEAYDYLRAEHEQFGKRLEISLNHHPDGKRSQDEIKGDWHAFGDEWDDIIEAARARFGSDVIDSVLAHMKINYVDRATRGKPLWKPGDPGPNPFGTTD